MFSKSELKGLRKVMQNIGFGYFSVSHLLNSVIIEFKNFFK